jgi:hypothetical protein
MSACYFWSQGTAVSGVYQELASKAGGKLRSADAY